MCQLIKGANRHSQQEIYFDQTLLYEPNNNVQMKDVRFYLYLNFIHTSSSSRC